MMHRIVRIGVVSVKHVQLSGVARNSGLVQENQVMLKRTFVAAATLLCAAWNTGCVTDPLLPGVTNTTARPGAAIVGTISANGSTGKALTWAGSTECPEVHVALNGNPADVIFDDECSFVIENVAP